MKMTRNNTLWCSPAGGVQALVHKRLQSISAAAAAAVVACAAAV
jgi:hypothetical protein